MKSIVSILLLPVFLFVSILMPYGNFDDNYATKEVYDQQQRQDPDLNIGEFIFVKLLYVGQIFDPDDDYIPLQDLPIKNQQPIQPMQIQSGSFDCVKTFIKVQEVSESEIKPTCLFKENKFSFDFHASIFHPPAVAA